MADRLLVIGARKGSLGEHIANTASAFTSWDVSTAGISGENLNMNVRNRQDMQGVVEMGWDHVVLTTGINQEGTIIGQGWLGALERQVRVNYMGPTEFLSMWCRYWRDLWRRQFATGELGSVEATEPLRYLPTKQFVAITSNSAQVARSKSGSYCASKAALEMMVRCAGREVAESAFNIYGYAPGWISGTPMSDEVESKLGGKMPHRIPGGFAREVDARELAAMIVSNLTGNFKWLNGTLLRVDGGEQ